ncbi:hypothetical protein PTKIN_Ptkin04bG0213200 [Pterospermum kingtungense]
MADTDSYIKQHQLLKEHNQANPSKYHTHFLHKAFIVIVFLVIIPVFPSQAPEFINQNLLNRSWGLLHLLFVGIAVSYGLFSGRNDETEKENNNNNQSNKFDNVQSFVSRFLQVSSVFDDEAENLSGSDDQSKVQTWSSQYYRNEPPVVVAKEQAVLDEHESSSSRIADKPLLLPVRSLTSHVLEVNNLENSKENGANSRSFTRSISSLSSKSLYQETKVEKFNETSNVVLPSPIPWRSRSGRVEVKEDIVSEFNNRLDESRSFSSQTTRLSRSTSMSSSPNLSHSPPLSSTKMLPPSPSLSMEAQAKSTEDAMRKKGIYRSPAPPPPPPSPPLSMIHKPSLVPKPISFRTEKLSCESASLMPKPTFREFPREEKQEFVEKLVVETTDDDDDDSESEDEEVGDTSFVSSIERRSNNEKASTPSSGIDGGCDVDKKADEFIAKVREQIRLQRIDSIKRNNTR